MAGSELVEVVMKYLISSCVAAFALMILPFAGCGGSTTEGGGGDAGAGGTAGSAGTAGASGTAGNGGTAGGGGTAGTGGSGQITLGLWTGTGTGDGADGPFTICFNVAYSEVDDRTYLRKPPMSFAECNHALEVSFQECEGGFSTTGEIRVIDGAFREFFDQGTYIDIAGTFDGDSASGTAELGENPNETCSGTWTATPSN